MPRISTTTRIGATAVAASLATALAGPGGAAAIEVPTLAGPDKIVKAVQQDAGQIESTLEQTLDSVAPNTRQAVNQTVQETVAKTRKSVDRTVARTRSRVPRIVRSTTRTVSRTKQSADRLAGRTVKTAGTTVNGVSSTTQQTVSRTRTRAASLLSGGTIVMRHAAIGSWIVGWSRSSDGCISLQNIAPLSLNSRLHVGAQVNGKRIGLDQRGASTSAQAGC